MAWEDDVTRVCGAGRPREVFALAERWRKLGDALVDLQVHVSRIGTKTANDGDLPKEAARYVTVVPQGNSWTGTAADAFREHVAKLAEDIGEVTQAVLKVSASVDRAGEALCAGISRTPVPVFFDRDLPNGVDVEDVVNGQAVGGDSGTVFAKRLTEDISKGQKYYESGTGFKKKLDDTLQFSGDGVVREGKSQGSTPGIAWWEGWHTERYKRERDQWYAQNAGVAETAFGDLRTAYSTERRNVAPEELRARTDVSAATPFGVDPAGPRKPAGVPPMPDSLTGDAGAGAARMPDVGAAGAGGLGSTGGAHFEPPGSNVVPTKAEHLDGSSLAGAGGGLGGARQARRCAVGRECAARRRTPADRGRTRSRQDRAGQGARQVDRWNRTADPVHAGPAPCRRDRCIGLQSRHP